MISQFTENLPAFLYTSYLLKAFGADSIKPTANLFIVPFQQPEQFATENL
jgi:hypothetical protein